MKPGARRDPTAAPDVEKKTGGAGLKRGVENAQSELATVLAYHAGTHSADVRTLGVGGRPLYDVAQLKTAPGDFTLLETGNTVVISWELGFMPIITGVLDIVGRPLEALGKTSLTGTDNVGTEDPLQPVNGANNYRPANAPPDLMAGDWAHVGDRGQAVAVLKGGVAYLGSPTAQVRSLGLAGLLQFIGQRMQSLTDFGRWETTNDQGKTSFILRAGSDQATQSGFDEEHWTIRVDLGATGNLFNFEITTPEGQTLFRFHVGPDGRFELYGAGGHDISSGKSAGGTHDHLGDQTTTVAGSDSKTVDKDITHTAGGKIIESAGTDRSSTVGNDESHTVNRHKTRSIGGKLTEVVAGGAAKDAKEGQVAKETVVLNGDYSIDIGDPDKQASSSAKQALKVKTHSGDISVESGAAVSLKAKEALKLDSDDKVKVNGDNAMPLWPTFRQDLYQFLTLLISGLQSGTVGTPVKQQLVVLTSTIAQLQQFTQKLASSSSYDSQKATNG